MQLACSHSAKMFLPSSLALRFRRGQLTVLKLDSLQGTSGGTGTKPTKLLVGFMQSPSDHVFLDLPRLVLEMHTFVVG